MNPKLMAMRTTLFCIPNKSDGIFVMFSFPSFGLMYYTELLNRFLFATLSLLRSDISCINHLDVWNHDTLLISIKEMLRRCIAAK